jgi:sec-independent protein translocase protein TatB
MFDVGFWELALIGLVMLVVVGPERLPKIARTAGLWLGRGRRMLSSVKAEIDREIKAEELKEILNKQARSNPLETILDDPKDKPAAGASEPGSETARADSNDQRDSRNG